MEPCLFWSSWLLLRAGLVCVFVCVCVYKGEEAHHIQDSKPLFSAYVDRYSVAAQCGGPLCSSRSGRSSSSSLREPSHLDPGTRRGRWAPVSPAAAPSLSIGTLCRAIGLWGGCEAWTAVSTSHSTVGPASLSLCRRRRGGEWARPHCRTTESRRRWRVTATFCRLAPSWRALCSVSTHDAADSPHLTSGNIILHLLSKLFYSSCTS